MTRIPQEVRFTDTDSTSLTLSVMRARVVVERACLRSYIFEEREREALHFRKLVKIHDLPEAKLNNKLLIILSRNERNGLEEGVLIEEVALVK